jgi:outer membrane immunogenic protein
MIAIRSGFVAVACTLFLAALPAKGADLAAPIPMPVKAAPVPPPYSWTGFYVGGNAGYSWGPWDSSGFVNGFAVNATPNLDGALGGGQIGYNWQFESWVSGIEIDGQVTGEKKFLGWLLMPPFNQTTDWQFPWFVTVRAREGFAVNTWLFYVTGGLAVGESRFTANFLDPNMTTVDTRSQNDIRIGWTVGGGIEAAVFGNWTAKVEYLYVDLGTDNFLTGSPFGMSTRLQDNIGRVGVNYRFGAM